MTGETLITGCAIASFALGMGALGALVSMQRRLCELKTRLDVTEVELRASRRQAGQALASLQDAERRARLATHLLADQQDRRGFEHVNLAHPADVLPDLSATPLEDDPWVAEMRQRWLFDIPLTSEDEY